MIHLPISVVIPTYNREQKILTAIESVLKQTRLPEEILVVDDGSTDGTISNIQERFSDFLETIRILTLQHRGVSYARNRGVEIAKTDWVAFLDSDDEWFPKKLERQWEFLQKNADVRILQSLEVWIRNGKRVNPPAHLQKKGGWIFEESLEFCAVTPSSVILQKKLFLESGGMDEALPACEDYDLWLRISSQNPVFLLNEELLIRYGGHEDQLSFQYPVMDRFRIYSILKLLSTHRLTLKQEEQAKAILFIKWNLLKQGRIKRNLWISELDSLWEETIRSGLSSRSGISIQKFLLTNENWTRF
ncbi:glycosyltransferase family 2 protein [Leptospira sp. 201903070]|uniref:Glycosyltransferase family 2 protein n=1 Tax=Leptospira ainlahdjerensis TaxID=2810033 RepID=A0ABS2UEP9_9LEPT|nr:glycosyltransferase family A protein [Leptospira ainlahdjerensis]MBM9578856.1 glycosyltransferase family 2 protein [Leptospira ainlahdjerensis]